jgi:hypothetical protein
MPAGWSFAFPAFLALGIGVLPVKNIPHWSNSHCTHIVVNIVVCESKHHLAKFFVATQMLLRL